MRLSHWTAALTALALAACGAQDGAGPAAVPDAAIRDGSPAGADSVATDGGADTAVEQADADTAAEHGDADAGGPSDITDAGDDTSDEDTGPDAFEPHPDCVHLYGGTWLLPGPCEPGYDADLAAKARRHDRVWRAFNAAAMGVNTDVAVAGPEDRATVEAFATSGGWDFEAFAGAGALSLITRQDKVAGLYAGVGIAADAFRYAVLRDQGQDAEEIALARAHLLAGLEGLHRAVAITGVTGVIARGYARKDLPGSEGIQTVPLFDEDGQPLPPEKNNGTWREPGAPGLADYVWEDSISRDQMLGWVTAFAAAWEAIRDDATIPAEVRDRLRDDALHIGRELMVVRESGYDLEIPDADGRTTLHGYLHETNVEGVYLGQPLNGFHALMALGFASAWVYVTDDPELKAWLLDDLVGKRKLHELVRSYVVLAWAGNKTNYSNTNMAFGSMWLAQRYLDHAGAQTTLREALATSMYAIPGEPDQPETLGQSYFDFIYAAGMAGQRAGGTLSGDVDAAAMGRGLDTLRAFPQAPYWNEGVVNCPAAVCSCEEPAVASSACTGLDGTQLTVLGCVGRSCDLICDEPVPMGIRPPSNYHWRSNPFRPNGEGDGTTLLPGVDFRIAYWSARAVRRSDAQPAP
ncbi:MAG: hypothetical protein AMXMBFR64_26650 [Myxococcales bacterium]